MYALSHGKDYSLQGMFNKKLSAMEYASVKYCN